MMKNKPNFLHFTSLQNLCKSKINLKMLSLPPRITYNGQFTPQKPPKLHFCTIRSSKFLSIRSSSSLQEETQNSKQSELDGTLSFPPIKAAKRVVLVRHGQSTWNKEGRIQGSSNFSVLTPKGEAQAETSRQMLVNDTFDVCFASPLNRSKRTAEVIWGDRQKEIVLEYELREIDLYSFQGLLKHEGKAKFGEAYRLWQIDAPNFSIDGHYPVRELWARARNSWSTILAHEGKSVLVVAHNAVNQALIATAIGLGTEYFRNLLQSNCGVSVLDFTPCVDGESPHICLNRLNQTPNSPLATISTDGRKASKRIILSCHGSAKDTFTSSIDGPMNMLGIIQSQKTAELLLDLKVSSIICSPQNASLETAMTISRVQEAADCLGADSVSRYVEIKQLQDLAIASILGQLKEGEDTSELWNQSGRAWKLLLEELSDDTESQKDVVVVGDPAIHTALITRCLNLTKDWMGSFHLDAGSITIIDFPDGPALRGVIRCVNYTAHLGRWSIPVTKPTINTKSF